MAARGRHRGKARHGDFARRSPCHDRAWRQGAGGIGGVPGRHHDIADGYAAPQAHSCSRSQGARRARHCGVGRQEGRRSGRGRRGARGDAGRYRGRIPSAALCGDDARGRPPDRRRLHARQHELDPQMLLVRPDRQRARAFRNAGAATRNAGRHGQALYAAGGCGRSGWRGCGQSGRHGADRAAVMAARRGRAGNLRRQPAASVRSGRKRCCPAAHRRGRAVAGARLAARYAGAPAAAILAGTRPRTPPRRGDQDISPATPTAGPSTSARRWRSRCSA